MDGAADRLDCVTCRITWYRRSGTNSACPACGEEMTVVRTPFVAIEIEGASEAARESDAEHRSEPRA